MVLFSHTKKPNTIHLWDIDDITNMLITVSHQDFARAKQNPKSFLSICCVNPNSQILTLVKLTWLELEWMNRLRGTITKTDDTITFDLAAVSDHKIPLYLFKYHDLGIYVTPDMQANMQMKMSGTPKKEFVSDNKVEIVTHDFCDHPTLIAFPNKTRTSCWLDPPYRLTDILIVPTNMDPLLIKKFRFEFAIKYNEEPLFMEIQEWIDAGTIFDPKLQGFRLAYSPPSTGHTPDGFAQILQVEYDSPTILEAYVGGLGVNTIRFDGDWMGPSHST